MEPIDVNIYILNLEEGKEPRIERMPGQIIEDELTGETPLIQHIGPNDFEVWYDNFEVGDLDVTHLALPNIIEIVTRRESPDKFALERIVMFCKQKLNRIHKELDMFEEALGLAVSELTQIYKEETEHELKQN